jgi:hypothetical protein
LGAGLLLPNGKAFFLGCTGKTALYTPTGNPSRGTWAAGPDIPNDPFGNALGACDAPAAMLVNGKVLCGFGPAATVNGPTRFYEYDPSANSFINVYAPSSLPFQEFDVVAPYQTMMLNLPDGTVLYSHENTDLYVYQPDDGSPLAAAKPTIGSIQPNSDGSYHLTGTKLNGISEGAAYGDDAQMDSNYPLVRLTDSGQNVTYATTYNWSSTSVMTGNKVVTTEFRLPASVFGGSYSLAVVANGISSDPTLFAGPIYVDFNAQGPSELGSVDAPYKRLTDGVSAVFPNGAILIKSAGLSTESITISKQMTILALGGPATIRGP